MKRDRPDADRGFTLIEVVVALGLLTILASAALGFFIKGTRAVSSQQRTQSAVAVANDAMEDTFARVATMSSTGTSGLVVGRTQADVLAVWNAAVAAGVTGLSTSFPAWDMAVTGAVPLSGTSDDTVKLGVVVSESRIDYTVNTLIGACYRRMTLTPSEPCTKLGGNAAGVASAGYARLMSAVVVVTWPDVNKTCPGDLCRYQISSLLDPSQDLEWNNTTRLLAADDSISADAGETPPVLIDVLPNDTMMQVLSDPIASFTQPVNKLTNAPMGTVTEEVISGQRTGKFLYVSDETAHGEVNFTYRITVGARTAQATVHIYVIPRAFSYAVPATIDQAVTIPVTTRSGQVPTALTATGAGVTVSGSSFIYTAPHVAGTYSFTYTYEDAEGVSLPGTVTIAVSTYAPPTAAPLTITIPAYKVATAVGLDLLNLNSYASPYKIKILSAPTPTGSNMKIDTAVVVANGIGTNVTVTPPVNVNSDYTFSYATVTPDGVVSPPATVKVQVRKPTAGNDPYGDVADNGTRALAVGSNDTNVVPSTVVRSPLPNGCGAFSADQRGGASLGIIYIDMPNINNRQSRSCSFTYTLEPTDSRLASSDSATVTYTVKG